jgi:hypothetical protein
MVLVNGVAVHVANQGDWPTKTPTAQLQKIQAELSQRIMKGWILSAAVQFIGFIHLCLS